MTSVTPSTVHKWAKASMKKDEIDSYRSDLYIKVTPVSEYMVKNLWDNRYSKPKRFTSQIDGEMWYEFPFAALETHISAKKTRRKI